MHIESQTRGLSGGSRTVFKGDVRHFRPARKRIRKWLSELSEWKNEALLIKRLSDVSLIGEEQESFLYKLNIKLVLIIEKHMEELSSILEAMLIDLKILKDPKAASPNHMHLAKMQMRRIAEDYRFVKENIIREIIRDYPLKFI